MGFFTKESTDSYDQKKTSLRKSTVIPTVAAAFTAVSVGVYGLCNMWSADGTEYVYEVNKGRVSTVATEGVGIAWGWFEKVKRIPSTKQITSVSSDNANLRSSMGETFEGRIRIEYSFDLGEDKSSWTPAIQNFIKRFGLDVDTEIRKSLNSDYQDPVEKLVQARAQTIAGRILAARSTDAFQTESEEIAKIIEDDLQKQLNLEGLSIIKIEKVDNSGLAPGDAAQTRIDRIASERREGDRADVVKENEVKLEEEARISGEVFASFAKPLTEAGMSDEAIVEAYCNIRMEKADRLGIPFGTSCAGGNSNVNVSIPLDSLGIKPTDLFENETQHPAPVEPN